MSVAECREGQRMGKESHHVLEIGDEVPSRYPMRLPEKRPLEKSGQLYA